ncbi:hypothetical protein D9615_002011 [Tricholomella constricta]|uniref:F-box domain-containing protein n=1 Tax=Tricholomella constricta TaxID=117010 RepID=A0A8H5MA16_9AGAR|nr:hypothetical protein D9615_002011 [Tricholomella constricta]
MSSHIDRIPLELLEKVFKFYASDGLTEPSLGSTIRPSSLTSTLSFSASPFILGAVCSLWRETSLAMPCLWSSLAVYRPRYAQIGTIRLWLERSKEVPLSLYLYEPFIPDPANEEARESILFLFLRHAHRWKHFYAKLSGDHPAESLCTLPINDLIMLESVELDFREHVGDYGSPWLSFYKISSLRRVTWDSSSAIRGAHNFAPWSTLTHVKLPLVPNLTIDSLLKNILYAVNLVDLEVAMSMPLEPLPPPPARLKCVSEAALESLRAQLPPGWWERTISDAVALGRAMQREENLRTALFAPIDLPNLQSLKIHAHGRDAAPLLDRLKLPELKSLHILHYTTYPVAPSTRYIIALLERSGLYKLDTLSIYDPDMREDEVVKLLTSRRLQALRKLELLVSSVGDNTVQLLFVRRGMQYRLPYLTHLVLPDCVTSEGMLLKMVVSRQPLLNTVKFCVTADTPMSDVAKLRKLASRTGFCLSTV